MTDLITLTCPSCGGKITVTPGTSRYICEYCGNEHVAPRSSPLYQQNTVRPAVPQPESITITREGAAIRLTRRWFSWKYVPMAFFCVAWDAFLIFWYGIAFSTKAPWIMIVFPIAHLAVGVGLTYSTLAGFLNRTVMEVTRTEVNIWHEPLPWAGNILLKTGDVAQFYCAETPGSNNSHSYNLFAALRDGQRKKLLAGLDTPDIGLFIEQRLESWLKIPDQPVGGEIARE